MATNLEIGIIQKQNLKMLLDLKLICTEKKFDFPELQKAIDNTVVTMTAEDVALVEKIAGINALNKK